MAAAAVTTKRIDTVYGLAHLFQWAALTNTVSPGAAISVPVEADRTVQFEGTWGAGTTVLEGSNDDDGTGTVGHYHTLHDPLGNAISYAVSGLFQISENPRWIRCNVSGADGNTNVTVTVMSRGVL